MRPTFSRPTFLIPLTGLMLAALFLFPRVAAADSSDSLAGTFHYMLVGVAQAEGISYASLIDRRNGNHYLLSTNTKSELDVELSSVQTELDPLGPSAVIRKGGTFVLLKTEPITALNTVLGSPAVLPAPDVPVIPPPGSATAVGLSHLKPPAGAALPLIFQEVDPKKLTLTDEQKVVLNQLRQAFIDDINGTSTAKSVATTAATGNSTAESTDAVSPNNASPDDQLKKWLSAQRKSDQQFRLLYGFQAFNAYQESISYPAAP